jgi:hypothetical protein
MSQLDDILRRVDANELTADDCESLRTLCKAYVQLTELLKDKNTSLARLRKLLFGLQTEKTKQVLGDAPNSPPSRTTNGSASETEPVSSTDEKKSPAKGHGRHGADAYAGAEKIAVAHETLQPGDPCPKCETGTIYETGRCCPVGRKRFPRRSRCAMP